MHCHLVSSSLLAQSKRVKHLGSGTFGDVYLYDTPDGLHVVKECRHKSLGYPSDFLAELDALTKFGCIPSVIGLVGACFPKDKKGYIILERMDCTLSQWYRKTPYYERVRYIRDIIESIGGALGIMHHYGFVHNDIKTNNILVRRTRHGYVFKLSDLGSAMYVEDMYTRYSGISRYRPPVERDVYSSECWAFMVCLVEVLVGKRVQLHDSHLEDYLRTVLTPEEIADIPADFWSFVRPILSGRRVDMPMCLGRLDPVLIAKVRKSISWEVPIHPKFSIVEDEYRKRHERTGTMATYRKFVRLLNKFLAIMGDELEPIDIKYYAEVAFIICARSKADMAYFRDVQMLLVFQRAFIARVGYQTVVLAKDS